MIRRFALLLLASCLLAGCGNKGALVLPDKPASPSPDAAPASG
ncbi:MAG: LPS translocon maturation chaperone LptM [Thermomonas sp.]|nr:lipoprotein [Thermomonas alba]